MACDKRVIAAICGKRSGKSEVGAIKTIMTHEAKRKEYVYNQWIDPHLSVLIAPTMDMLRRLSMKKFLAYAQPFIKKYNRSLQEIEWYDGSLLYGLSADRPERIEGLKITGIAWIDEVIQCSENVFLELKARTADAKAQILCTGSLGPQIINPKSHWAYKYFKERPTDDTAVFEWRTIDNPYFPADEVERLRTELDPRTFRSMFEIDWDTLPIGAVYDEFGSDNLIQSYNVNENLETYITIDWGFAHNAAVLFIQYNRRTDTVYVFDEIVLNRLLLEKLYDKIMAKARAMGVNAWVCDIAGDQEREQIGRSNVGWFREKGIHFRMRRTAVNFGIALVRSYIKSASGKIRLYVNERGCPHTVDALRRYRYQEKNGVILNDNPIKKDDDPCDALRYFFINVLDSKLNTTSRMIQL